jgi:hypothetical protein
LFYSLVSSHIVPRSTNIWKLLFNSLAKILTSFPETWSSTTSKRQPTLSRRPQL